jgi:hypothetical protein
MRDFRLLPQCNWVRRSSGCSAEPLCTIPTRTETSVALPLDAAHHTRRSKTWGWCSCNVLRLNSGGSGFESRLYTGCSRRDMPYFGRTLLGLIYSCIIKHTCLRSWTIAEVVTREKCDLGVPRSVPIQHAVLSLQCTCPSLSRTPSQDVLRWVCCVGLKYFEPYGRFSCNWHELYLLIECLCINQMILCFKYGVKHYRNCKFPVVLMYLVIGKCVTGRILLNLPRHYLRNRSTWDIDIVGYIYVI